MDPQKLTNVTLDEEPRELTNVTFDEIQVGISAEMTVTLQQQQIDVAAIVSGDVDAFYVKGPEAVDVRMEPRKTEAAGAEALISLLLGVRLPGPGTKIVHRDLHFSGDVATGDTLTAKVTAREKKEGNLVVFDCSLCQPGWKGTRGRHGDGAGPHPAQGLRRRQASPTGASLR